MYVKDASSCSLLCSLRRSWGRTACCTSMALQTRPPARGFRSSPVRIIRQKIETKSEHWRTRKHYSTQVTRLPHRGAC